MAQSQVAEGAPKYHKYRLLGRSGLRVSPLCLGAMQFGTAWGEGWLKLQTPEEDCEKVLMRYLELGGNFIDTASNYQDGQSEEIIGRILKKHNVPREKYVIATKFSLPNNIFNHTDGPNASGNIKKNLVRSVEQSLKRLQVDYIDILYVHFWDWTLFRPEDVMKTLEDTVIRTGKVLHLAVSDTPAWIVSRCNTIADQFGWTPFTAYQGRYSLLDRAMEQEIVPCCNFYNIGLVPWGILAQGKLTGRHVRSETEKVEGAVGGDSKRVQQMTEEEFKVQDVVIEVAKELGVTPAQVANNYAVRLSKMASPLIAPRTVEQLEDIFKSLDFTLSDDQAKRLQEATKNCPAEIFPTNFIGTGNLKWLLSGMGPSYFEIEK